MTHATMTRILTLLLIAQVKAEWVEISQQHYRKPIRAHSHFTTSDKMIDIDDTTKPTYNNRSVTEYNWIKNPARPPNTGNVKRVQHIGSTVKTTERVKLEDDDLDLHVDIRDYELRQNYGPTRTTIELHELGKQKDTIKRVPNLGNIKRVQLSNSPVKSPAINFKGDREYSNKRFESGSHDDEYEDHFTEANDFEHRKNTETLNRRIYVNKVQNLHSTERTATFPPDEDEDSSFAEVVTTFNTDRPKQKYKNLTTVRNFYSTKPTFTTEDFTNYETQQDRFYKITNRKSSEVTEKNNQFTTEISNTEEDIVTKTNTKLTETTIAKANKNINDFNADSYVDTFNSFGNDEKQANIIANDYKTKLKDNNEQPKQNNQSKNVYEKEHFKEIKDNSGETLNSAKTEKSKVENKVNTMENLIKFMRVVADTISKNSRRSFSGKMQYLHDLKYSILANIKERIDATWPDDDSAGVRRHSRSAHASPRGHVQFPSSESALMTISFLTFAVFLIKLVLQVIQAYKHKTMVVAPVMVASGRNVFTHHD